MTTKSALVPKQGSRSTQRPPWWTDVKAAREQALLARNPSVLILNADSIAL